MKESDFKTRKGPVFSNVLLIDEINRAVPSPIGIIGIYGGEECDIGWSHCPIPKPFIVIATQNPFDATGTFPLPDAQLDRFLLTIKQGYPSPKHEKRMLKRFRLENPMDSIDSVISVEEVLNMKEEVKKVFVSDDIEDYLLEIVQSTRKHKYVDIGVSPRGSLAFMRAIQARAYIHGNTIVILKILRLCPNLYWGIESY